MELREPQGPMPGMEPISRRRFLQFAASAGVTASTAGLLAACGDDGGSAAEMTSGEISGSITFLKGPFIENAADIRLMNKVSAPFLREHREVKVKQSLYDWGALDTQLTTNFAGPRPADVSYLTNSIWPKFANAGALVDLTASVRGPEFESDFNAISEALWESATLDDKIYGIPWAGTLFPVIVNLDLLEQAGSEDWNESYDRMLAAAKAARKGDVYGFGMKTSYKDFGYQGWLPYIWQAGGDLYNADGTEGALVNGDTPEAWGLLQELHTSGAAPDPGKYDYEGLKGLFAAGRLAILQGQTDVLGQLGEQGPKFRWAMAFQPPGPKGQIMLADYGYLCMAAKSENQDAAWAYMNYLAGAEQVTKYLAAVGDPGNIPARSDTDYGDRVKYAAQQLDEFLPKSRTYPTSPKLLDALRVSTNEFEECISGRKSPDEALESANSAITEVLAS